MTRVLLVYHDGNAADVDGDELRRAGYEVDQCAGPVGGTSCPVLESRPCWQVEKADVLVYDTWDTQTGHAVLIEDLLALHPDKPLVLTSALSEGELSIDGSRAAAPVVAGSRTELVGAIKVALRQPRRDAALRRDPQPAVAAYHGPRW